MNKNQLFEFKPLLCFTDTETTSTNRLNGAILELGGAIEDFSGTLERFSFFARPHEHAEVCAEALDVNKMGFEEIQTLPDPAEMYKGFKGLLTKRVNPFKKRKELRDKFFFVGYNAPFDSDFVRQLFVRNGDDFYGSLFFNPPVCVMQMAIQKLMFVRDTLPDFKLGTVARYLGIEFDEFTLHGASVDADLTRQVFYKLLER